MYQYILASALWLFVATVASAIDPETEPARLDLANLKIGDLGFMPPPYDSTKPRSCCQSKISWKIGDDYFVATIQVFEVIRDVQVIRGNEVPGPAQLQRSGLRDVVIKGLDISLRNEGERIPLVGRFKVTGIAKVKSAKTTPVFVLEPHIP